MIANLALLIGGIITVLSLNAIGSIASNKYKFDYSNLAIISLLIYFSIGFLGTKFGNPQFALLCAAFVGFTEATIGWEISIKLSAYTKKKLKPGNAFQKNLTILFVIIFAFLIGVMGSATGNYLK